MNPLDQKNIWAEVPLLPGQNISNICNTMLFYICSDTGRFGWWLKISGVHIRWMLQNIVPKQTNYLLSGGIPGYSKKFRKGI
jgi:hypothetical protein